MDSIKQWLVNIAEPFYLKVFMPWFEGMGFILYGGGGKGDAPDVDPRIAQYAAEARFRPFSLTTSSGRAFGGPDSQFGAGLTGGYQSLQQGAVSGANQLLPQFLQASQQRPSSFSYGDEIGQLRNQAFNQALNTQFTGFNDPDVTALRSQAVQSSLSPQQQFQAPSFDLQGRTNQLFGEQSALLQPAFAQQRQALQSDLFGSGRLGLSLAGESIGAGQGSGMVQPDAFGLGRAQSQTLANLAQQSRGQALGEQQTEFGQALNTYGTNLAARQAREAQLGGLNQQLFGQAVTGFGTQQGSAQNLAGLGSTFGQQDLSRYGVNNAAQQQYLSNLAGGNQQLFAQGINLAALERGLFSDALSGELGRSGASLGAAGGLAQAYGLEAQQAESEGGKGLLGSIAGAAGGALGTAVGGPIGGAIGSRVGGLFSGGGGSSGASSTFAGLGGFSSANPANAIPTLNFN